MSTEITNNAESLHTNVKYTGFDIDIEHLKREMATLQPEFKIEIRKEIGGKLNAGKEMVYTLPFTKSQTENNYFFNSFQATLKRPGMEDLSTEFYADQRITAREAFNLLEGRSVEKKYNRHEPIEQDGKTVYKPIKDDTYMAWRKIDFTDTDARGNFKLQSFGEGYGFKFEEKLANVPLKLPLDDDAKKDLKKGEVITVTFAKEDNTIKGYLQANPKNWNFNTYDADMKSIPDINKRLNQGLEGPAESKAQNVTNDLSDQSQKQGKKEDNKNNLSAEKDAVEKKTGKKKSAGIRH
ncbi:hypothetical protein [Pedobacter sp. MC2016-24]|uniref:hypothetical protein n=1 Tax=Pedobacter sp. MC2016-24 TaxID=2780090 RepID=UPI00187FA7DA|nr:hypothetical protein [Pedobacter sp. MC2016-24]MBE9598643.1 hypothetical protein [Pedobacter sp. MC2016-24]